MTFGISVFRLWSRLEPVYRCTSFIVGEKPSSYGQDSIHSPQFVVFSVFDQFSDVDLRHNMIFIPIVCMLSIGL